MSQLLGVDISKWQGQVDFAALKKSFDFVIARCSIGTAKADEDFVRNRDGLRASGQLHGFYHYAYPNQNTPEAEAGFCFDTIGTLQPGELLALDFEEQYADPVGWSLRFLQEFEKKTGYKPLIYLNKSLVSAHDWSPVIKNDNGLWLADYSFDPNSTVPAVPWSVVAMRQYSDKGTFGGQIVDLDVFYGDSISFLAYGQRYASTPPVKPDLSKELTDAQAQIQLLTEKYADYDAIKNERDQIKTDFADFCTWEQEQLLASDASVTTLKSALTTKLQSEIALQDQLNAAQKTLSTEQQKHAQDMADLTQKANNLETQLLELQGQNATLLNQINDFKTELAGCQTHADTLNLFQRALESFQQLFTRK